jgi:hypothetical protein
MYKSGAQSPSGSIDLATLVRMHRKLSQAFETVVDEFEIVAVGATANVLAWKGSSVSTNTYANQPSSFTATAHSWAACETGRARQLKTCKGSHPAGASPCWASRGRQLHADVMMTFC